MQIEESRPIFAPHQTFWEPHLPPLRQNCLITDYYLRQCFRCCLSVSLLATLHKNFQTDLHETFSKGWQRANEQVFKFWWQIGNLDHSLDTGIVFRIHHYIHNDSPDSGTSKTCLGGGLHCLSASSLL